MKMSEAIIRDNVNKGIDEFNELIGDVHKHLGNRLGKIQERLNTIEVVLSEAQQGNNSKIKGLGKAKKITKGAMAAAAKTAVDVELLASQEDPAGDIKFDDLGLLDRFKKGAKSKDAITEDEGQIIVEIAAKMKDEFSRKLDAFEKRVDTIDNSIGSYEKAADKEKSHQTVAQSKTGTLNDMDKAYALISEMYQDLTKRFDNLEKKLDKIEKKIEKEMPGISFESSSKAKKSIIGKAVDGIKGLFKNNLKQNPQPTEEDLLHEIETKARERAEELDIDFKGDEPKTFKAVRENFKFGKFDANVLFPAIKDRTDDEFRENHYSKYSDPDKADTEYEMQSKRIEKLKEKGYIEKENGKYIITDKGKEAAQRVNKEFEFTSYDANVVFNYIKKYAGKLSLEDLKDSLKEEYKNEKDIERQFEYLQKRLENNVKGDYLFKTQDGFYAITDKGKEAAAKIKLKKNKENSIAL